MPEKTPPLSSTSTGYSRRKVMPSRLYNIKSEAKVNMENNLVCLEMMTYNACSFGKLGLLDITIKKIKKNKYRYLSNHGNKIEEGYSRRRYKFNSNYEKRLWHRKRKNLLKNAFEISFGNFNRTPDFLLSEIIEAVKNLKRGKSVGPDKITNDLLIARNNKLY
uniref:Uncharacterized protein n=1 Tax=Strongyloides venezuelensis TaxID=75913 RepID=A0A0K0EXJ7_STRVS